MKCKTSGLAQNLSLRPQYTWTVPGKMKCGPQWMYLRKRRGRHYHLLCQQSMDQPRLPSDYAQSFHLQPSFRRTLYHLETDVRFREWECDVSTVEVTVRYTTLWLTTLFLAIVCLTTYFYYLFITYYRLSGNIDLVAIGRQFQIVVGVGVSFCHLSRVYSDALEPLAMRQSSSQWLVRPTICLQEAGECDHLLRLLTHLSRLLKHVKRWASSVLI